jgi:hypothetical protein
MCGGSVGGDPGFGKVAFLPVGGEDASGRRKPPPSPPPAAPPLLRGRKTRIPNDGTRNACRNKTRRPPSAAAAEPPRRFPLPGGRLLNPTHRGWIQEWREHRHCAGVGICGGPGVAADPLRRRAGVGIRADLPREPGQGRWWSAPAYRCSRWLPVSHLPRRCPPGTFADWCRIRRRWQTADGRRQRGLLLPNQRPRVRRCCRALRHRSSRRGPSSTPP